MEGRPVPTELRASTVNVYFLPAGRPVTVELVACAPVVRPLQAQAGDGVMT